MKKQATILAALVAATATPALAQDATQFMQGAWECRLPEHEGSKTPPILYIGVARAAGGEVRTDLVEVDGFARAVYGMARVAPSEGGWLQLSPDSGAPFYVRSVSDGKGALRVMSVKRSAAGAAYRDRKSTRLNSSHSQQSRMPSSA